LEQDSRVVKAYDATGVSVAASLMGPPQQHEIDAFLSMVRNNHYDKVKDLLLRSSLQFMTDGGMGILYTKDEHGNTPIIVAAQQGHKKLIKMLVQAGVSFSGGNPYRWTLEALGHALFLPLIPRRLILLKIH
jgi:hypothetical protein